MGSRLTQNSILAYSPEQDDPIQPIGFGTATSNGGDNTTIIDVDGIGNSGAADTYNGRYFVRMLSGTYKGLQARIVDDDGAGTLTLEDTGFPGEISSGDEYQIFKSSEPIITCTAAGTSTTTVDSVRDEADDYWNGYAIEPINGSASGEVKLVTDFDNGTTTFTTAAFSAAIGDNNVAYLRRYLDPAANVSISPTQEIVTRGVPRSNFSRGAGIPAARGATISFDIKLKGSGSLAATGNAATHSELHGLMQACGYSEVIGTSLTVDDLSASTTSIDITTATHENVDIGQAIMHQGNVAYVTAKTDGGVSPDTLTVSPPLPVIPNNGDTLYACRMYKPDTDATQKGVTIYYERDGVRYTLFGCKGNVEFVPGGNTEILAKFSLTAVHFVKEEKDTTAADALHGMYSTSQPILGSELTCHLDTARNDISDVSVTAGVTASMKNVAGKYGINGVSELQVTNIVPMIRFSQLMDDSDTPAMTAESLFQTQTAKAVSLVYGSHGNCVAFRAPTARVVELPTEQDQDGLLSVPYAFDPQDAGTADDPTDGTVKVPDISVHIF